MKKEIKFTWNSSIVGQSHSMIIDGKEIYCDGWNNTEEYAKNDLVRQLKEDYNIDYDIDDIVFEWGGRL